MISTVITGLMTRVGVLDHPGPRSSHFRPVPKGGGVGIVAASLLGLAMLPGAATPRIAIAGGGILVAAIGYWDDRHDFRPSVKFSVQLLAALLPALLGLTPGITSWPAINAAISVCWLLLVTNAVNFMDGLNGLSAGTAAIAAAGFGLSGLTQGLIAGILGFLPWNYPRARIFMGDVGSQFCGYAVGVLALIGWGGPHPLLVPFALAAQLLDVCFTLVRRLRAGDRITQAHRGHLYQLANRCGVADWLVSLVYWALAGWGVVLGLLPFRPVMVIPLILPFALWAAYVLVRARRASIGRW